MDLTYITVYKSDYSRLVETCTSLARQNSRFPINHHVQMATYDSSSIQFLNHLKRVSTGQYNLSYAVEEDSGIYDGMNKSMQHASSDYVCFVNCGDTLISASSHHCLILLIQDIPQFINFTLDQPDIIALGFAYKHKSLYWDICGYSSLRNAVMSGKLVCQQSLLYSRRHLLKLPFDSRFKYAADYAHIYALVNNPDSSILEIPYALVQYASGGLSERHQHDVQNEIALIRAGVPGI